MMHAKDGQVWTMFYCRLVGYCFLVLTLFDLTETFFPLSIKDPNWLIQVMGLLVERSFAPLLGLVFVFWGAAEFRGDWERPIVKIISWLTLLVSLLYMLLIPLGISAALRIDKQTNSQVIAQYRQGTAQINQVKDQLQGASAKDLNQLFEAYRKQEPFKNLTSAEELKVKLPEQLDKSMQVLAAQTLNAQKQQRQKLLKNLVKWGLGALVIATFFLLTWRLTAWAR